MPKPRFRNTPSADLNVVREDVVELARQLGDSSGAVDLGLWPIGTSETPIPHGQRYTPKWRVYNTAAAIIQTRAPDKQFLYLQADSAATVGIEVW
jgi:hypothetical protein